MIVDAHNSFSQPFPTAMYWFLWQPIPYRPYLLLPFFQKYWESFKSAALDAESRIKSGNFNNNIFKEGLRKNERPGSELL
jgi:hypothetical protein